MEDQHSEWGEVEEKADIKDSDCLLNESEEHEIAMVVRLLSGHGREYGVANLRVQHETTFHLTIATVTATVTTAILVHSCQCCADTSSCIFRSIECSQVSLLLGLSLDIQGLLHFFSLKLIASSVNSANLLAFNIVQWVLKNGAGVKVVEGSDTGHGSVAHQDQAEGVLGAEVEDGHDLKQNTKSSLEEAKEESKSNSQIQSIILFIFIVFLVVIVIEFIAIRIELSETEWMLNDVFHRPQPVFDLALQVCMHEEGSNDTRNQYNEIIWRQYRNSLIHFLANEQNHCDLNKNKTNCSLEN